MDGSQLTELLGKIGFVDVGNDNIESLFLEFYRLTKSESPCRSGYDYGSGFLFFHDNTFFPNDSTKYPTND